jgi:hypothetical protein
MRAGNSKPKIILIDPKARKTVYIYNPRGLTKNQSLESISRDKDNPYSTKL